jgi:hypothetical protein
MTNIVISYRNVIYIYWLYVCRKLCLLQGFQTSKHHINLLQSGCAVYLWSALYVPVGLLHFLILLNVAQWCVCMVSSMWWITQPWCAVDIWTFVTVSICSVSCLLMYSLCYIYSHIFCVCCRVAVSYCIIGYRVLCGVCVVGGFVVYLSVRVAVIVLVHVQESWEIMSYINPFIHKLLHVKYLS